jgi:hypothetical protein
VIKQEIRMADGRVAKVAVHDDGDVWITHPDTGVDVGIGLRVDQPFVQVVTDNSSAPDVNDKPVLLLYLNEDAIYNVEPQDDES